MVTHALIEGGRCLGRNHPRSNAQAHKNLNAMRAMASAESYRCSAYQDDLRWRMVYQREALGYTYQMIAANLNVDTSTMWRMIKLFLNTGGVSKKN